MSYIDNNLISDEKIVFRTKKHFILFFYPIVWVIFSFFASVYMFKDPILYRIIWAPWFIALLLWAYTWLEFQISEFAVTNKRIMMREGFFVRHVSELRLNAISQVMVEQSLIGQMLNYGRLTVNAFGAFDSFSLIAQPYLFQKYVNEQADKAT